MKSQITRVEIPCEGCGEGVLVSLADSEADPASGGKISIRVVIDGLTLQDALGKHQRLYAAVFGKAHPRTLLDEMHEPLEDLDELDEPAGEHPLARALREIPEMIERLSRED